MAKLTTLAKGTLAFLVLAGGVSLIVGSLMGGGFSSRGYDDSKRANDDPRSILVQAVLVDSEAPLTLPAAGSAVSDRDFTKLLSDAESLRTTGAARVRTPAVLVQHAETGEITVEIDGRKFNAGFAPRVIDTKTGPVLRVAMRLIRTDADTSGSAEVANKLSFETVYTAAPGSAVVLDLTGLSSDGSASKLALRTQLIDPTPPAN